uniref:Uncharacterized protein n=1 Tax=Lotharella globosa TaxID=91324 RepID=A0A7S4DV56_9EUKA
MGNTAQKTAKTAEEIFKILDTDESKTLDTEELKVFVEHTHLTNVVEDLLVPGRGSSEITLSQFQNYFVKKLQNKELELKQLQNTVAKLQDTKSLIRATQIHTRAGFEACSLTTNSSSHLQSPSSPVGRFDEQLEKAGSEFKSKYGRVLKESGGMHIGDAWQERSLSLSSTMIRYYKQGVVRPMGEIPLKYVSKVQRNNERFVVKVGTRNFEFKANDKNECLDWVNAIEMNLMSVARKLDGIPSGKFWKCEPLQPPKMSDLKTIPYKTALSTLKTGDILLFQTKGVGPSIIRRATRSSYDHVGMFVRRGGRLGVLESLGDPGVLVSGFHAFYEQGWFQQYTGLVIRRLEPRLPKAALRELQKFCRVTHATLFCDSIHDRVL